MLSCLYSNVDQLLNKMEDLKMMIASSKPDLMIFTEVLPKAQIKPIQEPQLKIKGYDEYLNFIHSDSNLGKSGIRGVAIYINDDLQSKEIKLSSPYRDHVWVEINLLNDDSLLCGCIYRSPTNEKSLSIETTTKVCKLMEEATMKDNTHILICGDFNYPDIDWENDFVRGNNTVIRPFIDMGQSCYLHQHISEPTRYRQGDEPSLLGLIFSNEEGMVYNISHNLGLGESDHTCIHFTLNCYGQDVIKENKPNYFKANYETIREMLRQVNWGNELHGDFSNAYTNFTKVLDTSS